MYINDLKFFTSFKDSSLYDTISQTHLNAVGDNVSPSFLPDGSGYIMRNDQYLVGIGAGSGLSLGVSDKFSISFWLYPVYPGMVTNPVTGNASSIVMPLISLAHGSSLRIEITEHTRDDGNNDIEVSLNSGLYLFRTIGGYPPSMWHHFYIVFFDRSIYIYIDGDLQTLVRDGTSIFALDAIPMDIYINHSLNGYDYNISKNYGYLKDLFVLSSADISASFIQRIINLGTNYALDDNFTRSAYDYYPSSYTQNWGGFAGGTIADVYSDGSGALVFFDNTPYSIDVDFLFNGEWTSVDYSIKVKCYYNYEEPMGIQIYNYSTLSWDDIEMSAFKRRDSYLSYIFNLPSPIVSHVGPNKSVIIKLLQPSNTATGTIRIDHMYIYSTHQNLITEKKHSVYFNDPSTITVSSAIDDMSYVYLGRNDGKILCGSPLFWECRKTYSDLNEASLIDVSNNPEDTNSVSGGFLKIKDKIIRL